MNNFFYKIDKKSIFFTSLGDFLVDRLLRQFYEETNCGNLRTHFHNDLLCNNSLYVLKTEMLSANAAFVSLILELTSMSFSYQIFLKVPKYYVTLSTQSFSGVVFREIIFLKPCKVFLAYFAFVL